MKGSARMASTLVKLMWGNTRNPGIPLNSMAWWLLCCFACSPWDYDWIVARHWSLKKKSLLPIQVEEAFLPLLQVLEKQSTSSGSKETYNLNPATWLNSCRHRREKPMSSLQLQVKKNAFLPQGKKRSSLLPQRKKVLASITEKKGLPSHHKGKLFSHHMRDKKKFYTKKEKNRVLQQATGEIS